MSAKFPASFLIKSLPLAILLAIGGCTDSQPDAGAAATDIDSTAAAEPDATVAAEPKSSARGPALEELTPEEFSATINDVGRCMIDSVSQMPLVDGQELAVDTSSKVQFVGWVGDPETQTFPQDPVLRFDLKDANRAWEVGLGEPFARAPVAEMYKTASMEKTGFNTEVDLSALPPGTYSVRTVYNIAGDPTRRVGCSRDFRIRLGG